MSIISRVTDWLNTYDRVRKLYVMTGLENAAAKLLTDAIDRYEVGVETNKLLRAAETYILVNEVRKRTPPEEGTPRWIMDMQARATRLLAAEQRPTAVDDYVVTAMEFKKMAEGGTITDNDGTGYFMVNQSTRTRIPARPSDVKAGLFPPNHPNVVWFNK